MEGKQDQTACERGEGATVEARGLQKVCRLGREEVHALRGVNFRVDPGDFVVINGPREAGRRRSSTCSRASTGRPPPGDATTTPA
jgi:ABC-type multidrug transport system ATPase subunit